MIKTGVALATLLEAYGVEVVFGIPGTHSIELYRGLQETNIRHVLTRHEQGAGFMADGYARVTGNPGVCFVITGPGVTNIATPIAQAMSDAVPILLISPVNDEIDANMNFGRLHEISDQSAVTKPICAYSDTAKSSDDIEQMLERAFALFTMQRPGPVHINIPLSVLRSEVKNLWQARWPAPAEIVDQHKLQAIHAALLRANSPLVVAGGGCQGCAELVPRFAELYSTPVATTVAGRGVIPGSHPLSLGAQTEAPLVQQRIAESDLLLVLGSELAEPDHWADELILPSEQIWINLDPDLLRVRAPGLALCTDVQQVLLELARMEVPPSPDRQQWAYALCKQTKEQVRDNMTHKQRSHWRVLTEIKKALPDNVCVFSDMTQLAYTAIAYLPLQQSNSWMHPNGYGTLGYALPAAIGAGTVDSQRPLLVIVGDAGFQYTCTEMAIAVQEQMNLVVLLWQNHALLQIQEDMREAGIAPIATEQPNPDFVALATVYGWQAQKLKGLFELGQVLETAFATSGPVLLELDQNAL